MLVLGLHFGALRHDARRSCLQAPDDSGSAAVLLNGRVVAAASGRDLDHAPAEATLPLQAAARCLAAAQAGLADVGRVAIDMTEPGLDAALLERALRDPRAPYLGARAWIAGLLRQQFGVSVAEDRLHFVEHHQAQLHAAWLASGFEQALCLGLDGTCDGKSAAAAVCDTASTQPLWTGSPEASLAGLAWLADDLLGLHGQTPLAAHELAGPAARNACHALFDRACTLGPEGSLRIASEAERLDLLRQVAGGRHAALPNEPQQLRREIGAALLTALLRATRHVLDHLAGKTPLRQLCLCGGAGVVPGLVGALALDTRRFDRVFASAPAAGEGTAVGAAALATRGHVLAAREGPPAVPAPAIDPAAVDAVDANLSRWRAHLDAQAEQDPQGRAAEALASGARLAWLQGGGATGRCWLASPAAGPLPPPWTVRSVLIPQEQLASVLEPGAVGELPAQVPLRLPIRAELQARLAPWVAEDGTAVLQAVSAARDPLRHGLLRQVGILSGLPMLLEALPRPGDLSPSVDRLDELWSTLCSGVFDAAFVGPWQVRRTAPAGVAGLALDLSPRLGRGRRLSRRTGSPGPDIHAIEAFDPFTQETAVQPISRSAFQVLSHARPGQPLRLACQASGTPAGPLAQALHDELLALWRSAGLCLVPAAS